MKVLWIGGNHPRHLYFANQIEKEFQLCGSVIQVRENIMPEPSEDLDTSDRLNFVRHFENRVKAEEKYFAQAAYPAGSIMEVTSETLNSAETAKYVKELQPDIVMIFGCDLIKEPLFSALPMHKINLHLGISPRYRGSATLFWPFYFLEPSYAGCTFHYIVDEPDAGEVIHQVVPVLEIDDGIHDIGCKAVIASAEDVNQLLHIFNKNKRFKTYKQKGTGKNFLSSDFRAEHLRVIYNLYNDDMVKAYLEGNIKAVKPNLVKQF